MSQRTTYGRQPLSLGSWASHSQDTQLDLCQHVRIAKVCNDMDEPVPAGVEVLLANGNDEQQADKMKQREARSHQRVHSRDNEHRRGQRREDSRDAGR